MEPLHRKILIVAGVVLLHAVALWALQAGMLRRPDPVDVVVPVVILGQLVTPQAPKVESPVLPSPPPPKRPPVAKPAVTRKAVRPSPPVAPRPAPPPETRPLAEASRADVTEPAPGPPASTADAVQTLPAPASASAGIGEAAGRAPPGKVEQPSTDASYLQNPTPVYPPISKRLGEQGRVVVRVLIGADGVPQKAVLKLSSGFERLDRSALDYVMRCRYVPGKVGGMPQAMWYEAPVSFVLE